MPNEMRAYTICEWKGMSNLHYDHSSTEYSGCLPPKNAEETSVAYDHEAALFLRKLNFTDYF